MQIKEVEHIRLYETLSFIAYSGLCYRCKYKKMASVQSVH